jgi:hypothetical protein
MWMMANLSGDLGLFRRKVIAERETQAGNLALKDDVAVELPEIFGPSTNSLFPPSYKLLLEMRLESGELVRESLSAAPTLVVPRQIGILVTGLTPRILLSKREVSKGNKEVGVEAVVVLPMLEPVRMHVSTDDVDVKMIHRWMCMNAHLELFGEVAPRW